MSMKTEEEIRVKIEYEIELFVPVENTYGMGKNMGWIKALEWVLGD